MREPHRLGRAGGIAALAIVGVLGLAPATAGAHSHAGGRHHHRHHHFVLTDAEKACLADHGFALDAQPRPDLRDPAVRAALRAALRDCGIVPAGPPIPTTTTTTTGPPVIPS